MKRGIWCTVVFLASAVACVSAVPQADLPETAFNEVDTPVNQAILVVAAVRSDRPIAVPSPSLLPTLLGDAASGFNSHSLKQQSLYLRVQRCPHSLQPLLCTFLI